MIEWIFFVIFFVIFFIITGVAIRNRILFRLGIRNLFRRKGYTMIVILGLMVGTGVISSSLVIGDTMNNMVETEILKALYTTDEIIVMRKPSGETDYFNKSMFAIIEEQLPKNVIDGISPHISDRVAVLNIDTNLSDPSIGFYGIDFNYAENFGSFINKLGLKITSLGEKQLLMGEKTADDLDTKVGDSLFLYANNRAVTFQVTYIIRAEERGGDGEGIYVSLSTAQQILNKDGMINQILISNKGGVLEGLEYTEKVEQAFDKVVIPGELNFELSQSKNDILQNGKQSIEQFSNLFTVFGTFSIIAGVILIINIFVMLAEDRKSEMGMSRAIGMQRHHLKRMYLFEGTMYALLASFVGIFFGIGVGYLLIFALEEIFQSFGAIYILQYFSFTPSSLIIGFVSGFFITILTIYATSHRISRINIVRAIRNIPEPTIPRSDKRMIQIGVLTLIGGILLIFVGITSEQIAPFISGFSLIIIGIGIIVRKWLGNKLALNFIGFLLFFLWVLPPGIFPDYETGFEMFIISGLFLVLAALLIVMSNADYIIKGLIFFIGRGKSRQAVLKTAISYALKSKFKTGMTVAIFSLVIFTITTMSMIVGMMGTNIENQVQKSSGGYEIMAFCNPNAPIQDIDQELKIKELDHKIEKTSAPITGRVRLTITDIFGDVVYYTLIGIDDQFIIENEFEFVQIIDEYENAQDAWDAIRDNSSLVIIDASIIQNQYGPQQNVFTVELGDIIGLQGKDNTIRSKKIIGILDTTYVRGLFSYESHVSEEFGFTNSTVFLFSVIEGQDVDEVSKQIESSFLKNGMQAFAIKSMVMEAIKAINQFFNLFNAFMGLGLIIGIAGLGVITIRSVHERRQQIGMMRAIGFQKRMILTTFLIETSTIALLGIIIGTLLGVFTGYLIWRDGFQQLDFDFIVNWVPILMMSTIAFFFTLICIFPSSKKASTIPPAEALRYEG